MLTVFGDESIDATQQKVFATAGLLGDKNQWSRLREQWSSRMGGKIFHASDCECGHGGFKGGSHQDNLDLYKDLTTILAKSGLIGFGVGIDLAGLRKYFPDAKEEQPYLACFLRTVKFLAEKAQQCIPRSEIEVVFDQNHGQQHNAGLIYQYLKLHNDWEAGTLLQEKVSFASRQEIGIQAADLWAREVMKLLECDLENRPRRKSAVALQATQLFGADLLCEGFYEGMRANYQKMQQQTGVSQDGYLKWLQTRADNQSNRILYLMFTVEQEQGH